MSTRDIKVTCPYYINSDRLLDLLASVKDGYDGTEEIEMSVTATHRKSRGFKGVFEKSPFSISAEGNKETKKEENEKKKTIRTHTMASLLNKTIEEIGLNDLTEPEMDFECGDIIKFTGKISQDRLGAEDYITFGFDTEIDDSNKNKVETELDQRKALRQRQQRKAKLISYISAVVPGLLAIILLIYGFINQPSMIYAAIFIFVMVLLPIILLTTQKYILHSTKDNNSGLSDHRAIKKDRKKVYEGRKVKILYDENVKEAFDKIIPDRKLYFVGELYDDYLYQSSFKDFLGRNVSCIGIVKHVEEHEKPYAVYGEVEIIAVYA